MQADYIAFAEGCDFERVVLAAGFPDHVLDRDGRAGGGVFFVRVVALENLAGVIVAQGRGGGAGDVEEEIYADGEVCGVEKSGSVAFHQMADALDFLIPTCGADDYVLAGSDAGFDVDEDAVGGGEVDDSVDVAKGFGSQGGTGSVFLCADDGDPVPAFGRYFGDY